MTSDLKSRASVSIGCDLTRHADDASRGCWRAIKTRNDRAWKRAHRWQIISAVCVWWYGASLWTLATLGAVIALSQLGRPLWAGAVAIGMSLAAVLIVRHYWNKRRDYWPMVCR